MAGTYSSYYDTFATAVLRDLGFADAKNSHTALVAWIGGEAGWPGTNTAVTHNNPLNIKTKSFTDFGITPPSSNYIKDAKTGKVEAYGSFPTLDAGAAATAEYLKKAGYYTAAITALQKNDGIGFLNAIASSPWSSSHYGINSGHNSLLDNLTYVLGAKAMNMPATGTLVASAVNSWAQFFQAFPHTSDQTWNDWLTNDPSGFNIIGQYKDQILKALSDLGIDPNSKMSDANVAKVAAKLQESGPAPAPGSTGLALPDIAGAITSFGDTIIQVFTYLIAFAIIAIGIWLYSKDRPTPIAVPKGGTIVST